jgi:pimeloyl-ACP methyl ester carboxylesterase
MLAYSDSGQGETIVLLHGFCENKSIWKSVQENLQKNHRIICIDFPGFGESDIYYSDFSMETLADEVARVLHTLEIQKCILIGHSMGGYVTLAFAEKYPELLFAFGLFQSTALPDNEQRKHNRDKTLAFIEKYGLKQFAESFVQQLFYPKNRAYLINEINALKRMTESSHIDAVVGCTIAMRNRKDRTHVLQQTTLPVLLVYGKEDQTLPIATMQAQMELCKNPVIHLLAETGHVAMIERPQESVKIIASFIQHTYAAH